MQTYVPWALGREGLQKWTANNQVFSKNFAWTWYDLKRQAIHSYSFSKLSPILRNKIRKQHYWIMLFIFPKLKLALRMYNKKVNSLLQRILDVLNYFNALVKELCFQTLSHYYVKTLYNHPWNKFILEKRNKYGNLSKWCYDALFGAQLYYKISFLFPLGCQEAQMTTSYN